MKTSILILAAGQSRRMRGRDKLLECVDGTPLLRLQSGRALKTGSDVFVAVPSLDHPRVATLNDVPVRLVAVPDAALGLSASLRVGLKAIPSSDAVLIFLADLVDIETEDLQRMLQSRAADTDVLVWRATTEAGAPGHPILISPSVRSAFDDLSGDQGGADILRAFKDQTRFVALPGDRARTDLDTPEDWEEWRAAHPGK